MPGQSEARTGAQRGPLPARVVRFVLAVGVIVIIGTLVLEMSRSAPRTAGSNRVPPAVFSVFANRVQTICQNIEGLPDDAGRVSVPVGTTGRQRPSVGMTFLGSGGRVIAQTTALGVGQGSVLLPLRRLSPAPVTTACLHIASGSNVGVRGIHIKLGPGVAQIDGKPQPALITISYYRRHNETWWQLLPVLNQRFGWGKAPFFGTWTLPFVAALALLLWVAVLRFAAAQFR